MIRFLKAIAPAALLAVAGCATPFTANVSRFQHLPVPQGQSFAIVADDSRLQGGLEFAHYADRVADRLSREGYVRANGSGDASLVVHLDYGVDHGRERLRGTPGIGPRFGYGFGWGRYRPSYGFGRRAWVYGFDDPFLYGSSYDEVESYTVYQSRLTMKIERAGSRERVFEGTATAMSSDNDLATLVPNLIDAMFSGFPGNDGQTVKITLAPVDKGRR